MSAEVELRACRVCDSPCSVQTFSAPAVEAMIWMCSNHLKLGGTCPDANAYLSAEAWNIRSDDSDGLGSLLACVAEQVKESSYDAEARWITCSGCYEGVDGQNVNGFPFSRSFGCVLGGGCSECGGIGAIWDTTDYADMAEFMLRQDALPATNTRAPALLDRLERAEKAAVPREPTEAMKQAGGLAINPDDDVLVVTGKEASDAWRAMYDAALKASLK